jgi:hypothetical protein
MAPPSQELEPPAIPGRFSFPHQEAGRFVINVATLSLPWSRFQCSPDSSPQTPRSARTRSAIKPLCLLERKSYWLRPGSPGKWNGDGTWWRIDRPRTPSDHVARGYIRKHGSASWSEIAASLEQVSTDKHRQGGLLIGNRVIGTPMTGGPLIPPRGPASLRGNGTSRVEPGTSGLETHLGVVAISALRLLN